MLKPIKKTNMKRITLLFFVLCSINAIGQKKLEIRIDNLEPRVGQNVTFSIDLDFLTEYLQKELNNTVKITNSNSIMMFGNFEREILFQEAKKYQIGPFNFEFNGIKYTTDSIEVNVLPELPKEDGLWLRLNEYKGVKYLILEQRIGTEPNQTYISTIPDIYGNGGNKPNNPKLAKLNLKLVNGIELFNCGTTSTTINGTTYSITKYKVKYDPYFNDSYVITEKNFEDLPKTFQIGEIELKK